MLNLDKKSNILSWTIENSGKNACIEYRPKFYLTEKDNDKITTCKNKLSF